MIEWRKFCMGAPDLTSDDAGVTMQFSERVALVAWERNRASSLVGFRVDDRGRLVGESWVPTPGLTRDEFLFYLRSAAAACDLFEYQLTGKDRE